MTENQKQTVSLLLMGAWVGIAGKTAFARLTRRTESTAERIARRMAEGWK